MNKTIIATTILALLYGASDTNARDILTPKANQDYATRSTAQKGIFKHLDYSKCVNAAERDALKFLYTYMATPDALDYDADFYLANIRASLQAAGEMPWGASVPVREWRHFVLPVRVNNEDLDLSRPAFYAELKGRVKNLSMKDAILEVNHWCHEKVTYQPSDARTSSPLVTVSNALGRCGEESTFTVAALRSVGIPARQVYTPRWAHTDDNHAWVEAWADGQWYFLGACEPEAVLDLAWFNAPASRGMLMNTKVTGAYDGPEQQLESNPTSTVINVTSKYAPVRPSCVIVTDLAGNPVKDATVNFSLYNYAEFYPVAVRHTDARGYAELTTGVGDMVIWAGDGSRFGLGKSIPGDTLRLTLDKDADFTGTIDLDLVPPRAGAQFPAVSAEDAALNDIRKAREDSIRNAYVATFPDIDSARALCRKLGIPEEAARLIVNSRGHHSVITAFLDSVAPRDRAKAVALLSAMSEKDLHDVSPAVLADHLATPDTGKWPAQIFNQYIMNPRVQTERLTPYKAYFAAKLTPAEKQKFAASPRALEKWMQTHIALDTVYNPLRYRMSPRAVWENRIADPLSRSIAFVAVCRSLGVPARIDPVSEQTQYYDTDNTWHDVRFGETTPTSGSAKGHVSIVPVGDMSREPKYFSQFTIAKVEQGLPKLLGFGDFEPVGDINARNEPYEAGQYVLVSGQRLADGSVLTRANFFRVNPGADSRVDLAVRQDTTQLQVIGSLNSELLYRPFEGGEPKSLLSTTGRGYYVLTLVKPQHEPSAHALNDIAEAAKELEKTGRKIMVIFPDAESASRFHAEDYGSLPSNAVLGVDIDGRIAADLKAGLELTSDELPITVVADTFNRIVFARQGYGIRTGEKLHDILTRLRE